MPFTAAAAHPLFADGVIYGTDCNEGTLIAVSSKDGSRLWETFEATKPGEKRFIKHGTAFLTRIGDSDRYLVMSETGDSADGENDRKRLRRSRTIPCSGANRRVFWSRVVWSHPAYAGSHGIHPQRQRNCRGRFEQVASAAT